MSYFLRNIQIYSFMVAIALSDTIYLKGGLGLILIMAVSLISIRDFPRKYNQLIVPVGLMLLSWITVLISIIMNQNYKIELVSPAIGLSLAALLKFSKDELEGPLSIVIYVQTLAVLIELMSGISVVSAGAEEIDLYPSGLYSYTKYASLIMILGLLFIRPHARNLMMIVPASVASLIMGTRGLTIVCAALTMDILFKRNTNKGIVFFLVILVAFILYKYEENIIDALYYVKSFDGLFSINSDGNVNRLSFASQHLMAVLENFKYVIFGSAGLIGLKVGNGSESAFVEALSIYGFFGAMLFVVIPVYAILRYAFRDRNYFMLIAMIIYLVGNRALLGTYDSILVWSLFFSQYNNRFKCEKQFNSMKI